MISWSVTFNDNPYAERLPDQIAAASALVYLNQKLTVTTDQGPKELSIREIMTKEVQLAGQQWGKYIKDSSQNPVDVNVKVIIDSKTTGTSVYDNHLNDNSVGAFTSFTNTVNTGSVDPSNGKVVAEPFAAYKIRTGVDANGSSPDIEIHINPDFWKDRLEHDLTTSRSTPVSPDKADAVSAFAHEIGHVLAFSGFQASANKQSGIYESPFDKYLVPQGNSLLFKGPKAEAVYGEPVPLTAVYHLTGSNLQNDLLYEKNGQNFGLAGNHREISPLDLAVLADCGFSINALLTKADYSNLIQNGSFEKGTDPGSYSSLQPGSTAITGWTVIRGGIDYYGSGWVSSDENRSLDLNGTPGVGGVSQTFATKPGAKYYVSFDLSGHPSGLLQKMGVSAAGQSADFSFQSGVDPNNLGWHSHTWEFIANAPQTKLDFYSLQTAYQYGGPALDNVRVEASPSPTVLNRVHFENHGYVGPRSGNVPVHGASGPNCQSTVSKLDAV